MPPAKLETLTQWLKASPEDRQAALAAAIERIRAIDGSLHAWTQVDPQPPTGDGPLTGIPFGIKEIIETRGLLTEYGSEIYRGRVGAEDAAIVRAIRQRGGVVMGKTVSTAFAYKTPAPTRNPRNLEHTPGGSSSGSAAAVAAGMVPVAVGTQTAGSVLRPASYCGVVGFKPTFGLLPMEGVIPFAASLDTLGFFTTTVADMIALWDALGYEMGSAEDIPLAVPDPLPEVDPPMAAALQESVARLRRAGVTIRSIELASLLRDVTAAHRTIMFYEGARFHEQRYREFGGRMVDVAELVREGLQISAPAYDEAKRQVAAGRAKVAELFKATPIILVPAAVGPPPRGLASTGDPRMNAPWTAMGVPAISIPMPVSGLPLGLQLTAAHGQEARLLRTAERVERLLKF